MNQYPSFDDYAKSQQQHTYNPDLEDGYQQYQNIRKGQEQELYDYPMISDQLQQQIQDTHQITHFVTENDTLEGLSLQYGVPMARIKQFNKLDSDFIYNQKIIYIPNPKSNYMVEKEEEKDGDDYKKKMKIDYMINFVLDKQDQSVALATYYLDLVEWDVKEAGKEYQLDKSHDKPEQSIKNEKQTKFNKEMSEIFEQKKKRKNKFLSWFKKSKKN